MAAVLCAPAHCGQSEGGCLTGIIDASTLDLRKERQLAMQEIIEGLRSSLSQIQHILVRL